MYNLDEILSKAEVCAGEPSRTLIALGLMLQLAGDGASGRKRLDSMVACLSAAVTSGKTKLYFDRYGAPVAYVAWATVNADVEQRLLREPGYVLEQEKINSGASLWVTDFFATDGYLQPVLRDMCDTLFREHDQITYFRFKGRRRIAKRISRHGHHAFLRSRPGGAG